MSTIVSNSIGIPRDVINSIKRMRDLKELANWLSAPPADVGVIDIS